MDRRQKKTRKAIFNAFSNMLGKKRYSAITVQEIIDEANVGRTTFYAHFETKDMLLKAMCSEIFEHIFSNETNVSEAVCMELESTLSHILFHLKNNEVDVSRILSSESEEEFIKYFKVHIENLFSDYVRRSQVNVPTDFYLSFLVDAFISAAKWWVLSKESASPDEMARYYTTAVGI